MCVFRVFRVFRGKKNRGGRAFSQKKFEPAARDKKVKKLKRKKGLKNILGATKPYDVAPAVGIVPEAISAP